MYIHTYTPTPTFRHALIVRMLSENIIVNRMRRLEDMINIKRYMFSEWGGNLCGPRRKPRMPTDSPRAPGDTRPVRIANRGHAARPHPPDIRLNNFNKSQ